MSERPGVSPAAVTLALAPPPPTPVRASSLVWAIDTAADVDRLVHAARALFAVMPARQVCVTAGAAASARVMAETHAINALLRHCGCVAGSVGGSLALVGALVVLVVRVGMPGSWRTGHVVAAVACALAVSLAAKFVSHVRARRRLVAHLLALRDALGVSAPVSRPAPTEV